MVLKSRNPDIERMGRASLNVEYVQGLSTATSSYSTSPMKLLVPRPRGISVWACTSSFGGGMVAGDQTRLDLRLGPKTCSHLGTQSWSKVYRNSTRLKCRHETKAIVGPEATLIFAPDPVQAFAGSSYTQTQHFDLAADASLLLLDWFTAGRVALGERWVFDQFQSRNEVSVNGTRIFLDAVALTPADGCLTTRHRLGNYNCYATLLLLGPALHRQSELLLEMARETPVSRRSDLVMSASPCASGAILRIAGIQAERVAHVIHPLIASLTNLLADDPWSRKW